MNISNDEIYDLYQLLTKVKAAHPSVQAVACGAILSTYQRTRVEYVCSRLSLVPMAWLWQRNQFTLLQDMIKHNLDARLMKVASFGLNRTMLGRSIGVLFPRLYTLAHTAGLQIAGEGGEYETITVNGPLYKDYAIDIEESEIIDSHKDIAHFYIKKWKLRSKSNEEKENDTAILQKLYGQFTSSDSEKVVGPITIQPPSPHPGIYATVHLEDMPNPSPFFHSAGTEGTNNGVSAVDTFPSSSEVVTSISNSPKFVWPRFRTNGPLIYLSNVIVDSIENTSGTVPLEIQAGKEIEQILQRISSLLSSIGSGLVDIIAVHLYFYDIQHFQTVNKIYGEFFYDHPPSRSAVQAHLEYLRKPHSTDHFPLVMMDCIVCQGSGKIVRDAEKVHSYITTMDNSVPIIQNKGYYDALRTTLYVSSLSYWAPLCIGPYCQSVTLGNSLVFPAGQIGLCPETMTIVDGGYIKQCIQALRNLGRVLQVCNTSFPESVSLTVYVSETLYENSQNYPENISVFTEKIRQCLVKINQWFCGNIPSINDSTAKDTSTIDSKNKEEDDLSSVTSESSYSGVSLDREVDDEGEDKDRNTTENSSGIGENEANENDFPLCPEAHLRPPYVPPKRKTKTSSSLSISLSSSSTFPKWSLPVNTVIVPRLPRNALIELECISFTHQKLTDRDDDEERKVKPSGIQCETDTFELVIDPTTSSTTLPNASVSSSPIIVFYYSNHYLPHQFSSTWLHIGVPFIDNRIASELLNIPFYSSLTSLLATKIVDILIHSKLTMDNLLHLRIYITGKVLSIPFFQENLHSHLQQQSERCNIQRESIQYIDSNRSGIITDNTVIRSLLPALSMIPVDFIAIPTYSKTTSPTTSTTTTSRNVTVPTYASSDYRIINNHVNIYTRGVTIHMLASSAAAIRGTNYN